LLDNKGITNYNELLTEFLKKALKLTIDPPQEEFKYKVDGCTQTFETGGYQINN